MSRILRLVAYLAATLVLVFWLSGRQPGSAPPSLPSSPTPAEQATAPIDGAHRIPGFLPPEAVETLQLIERGGPFPYERDGVTFQNREGRLPGRPRGYYREYTVPTPGSRDRGPRRIVAGGDPPDTFYYTDDHYRSFRRVEWPP